MAVETHVQQRFDLRRGAAAADAVAGECGGDHAGVVEDEHVAGAQESGSSRKIRSSSSSWRTTSSFEESRG